MKKQINIFRYVTYGNPDAARSLLLKNGFDNVPKNYEEVSRLLAEYLSRDEEKAFAQLLSIHPDLDAFKDYLKGSRTATGVKEENGEFLNCSACVAKLSADAASINPIQKNGISEKVTNALIIGGSVVLASIMVTIIITTAINAKKS